MVRMALGPSVPPHIQPPIAQVPSAMRGSANGMVRVAMVSIAGRRCSRWLSLAIVMVSGMESLLDGLSTTRGERAADVYCTAVDEIWAGLEALVCRGLA